MKASNKIYQLFVAKSVGLLIPETVISNDSSMVLKKSKLWNGTIFKSIDIPIGAVEDEPNTYIEVNPFKFERLDQIPEADLRINLCPGQWQKFIDKKYELRIHVIDEKIIAVKIDSQKNLDAKVDWRPFSRELDYFEYELPCEIRDLILIFMKNMNIKLGVIDMIVTPDDRYVFLEVNPDGNWLWIEDFLPNIGITRSIASWLLLN